MTRVPKTRRYDADDDLVASVGQSRDDLPDTDREQFAAVHLQAVQADAVVARALRTPGMRRFIAMLVLLPWAIGLLAALLSAIF